MTLACEDAYSKLVKVVTVANVDDDDRVGSILPLLFCRGYEGLVEILKLLLDSEDSEDERSWCLSLSWSK